MGGSQTGLITFYLRLTEQSTTRTTSKKSPQLDMDVLNKIFENLWGSGEIKGIVYRSGSEWLASCARVCKQWNLVATWFNFRQYTLSLLRCPDKRLPIQNVLQMAKDRKWTITHFYFRSIKLSPLPQICDVRTSSAYLSLLEYANTSLTVLQMSPPSQAIGAHIFRELNNCVNISVLLICSPLPVKSSVVSTFYSPSHLEVILLLKSLKKLRHLLLGMNINISHPSSSPAQSTSDDIGHSLRHLVLGEMFRYEERAGFRMYRVPSLFQIFLPIVSLRRLELVGLDLMISRRELVEAFKTWHFSNILETLIISDCVFLSNQEENRSTLIPNLLLHCSNLECLFLQGNMIATDELLRFLLPSLKIVAIHFSDDVNPKGLISFLSRPLETNIRRIFTKELFGDWEDEDMYKAMMDGARNGIEVGFENGESVLPWWSIDYWAFK
jgi:hypothetical protein